MHRQINSSLLPALIYIADDGDLIAHQRLNKNLIVANFFSLPAYPNLQGFHPFIPISCMFFINIL
jgi:hypothetical protein